MDAHAAEIQIRPSHAWVMEPRWIHDTTALIDRNGSTSSWCHFQLERVRGISATNDFRELPESIPPLLGKRALRTFQLQRDNSTHEWALTWNGKKHVVRIEASTPDASCETVYVTKQQTAADARSKNATCRHWQFVNVSFKPGMLSSSVCFLLFPFPSYLCF